MPGPAKAKTSYEWVPKLYLSGAVGANNGGKGLGADLHAGLSLVEILGPRGRKLSIDIGAFADTSVVDETVGPVQVDQTKLGATFSLPSSSFEYASLGHWSLSSRFRLSLRGFGVLKKARGEGEVEGFDDDVCAVYSEFNACSPKDPTGKTEGVDSGSIGNFDLHLNITPLLFTHYLAKSFVGFSGYELGLDVYVAGTPNNYLPSLRQEKKFGTSFGVGLHFAMLIGDSESRSNTGLDLSPLMDLALLGLLSYTIIPARELDISNRNFELATIPVRLSDGHLNSEVPTELIESIKLEGQMTAALSQVMFLSIGGGAAFLTAQSEDWIAYPTAALATAGSIYLIADGTAPAWHLLTGSLTGTALRLDRQFELSELLFTSTLGAIAVTDLALTLTHLQDDNDTPQEQVSKHAWRTTAAMNLAPIGSALATSPYSKARKLGYGLMAGQGVASLSQEEWGEGGINLGLSLGFFIADMVCDDDCWRETLFTPQVSTLKDSAGKPVTMLGATGTF